MSVEIKTLAEAIRIVIDGLDDDNKIVIQSGNIHPISECFGLGLYIRNNLLFPNTSNYELGNDCKAIAKPEYSVENFAGLVSQENFPLFVKSLNRGRSIGEFVNFMDGCSMLILEAVWFILQNEPKPS